MSLLERERPQPNRDARVATMLTTAPATQFRSLFNSWTGGMNALWESENPQAILDLIGTDAAELFQYSALTASFLEQLKPGCTTPYLAKMKEFTVNGDGSITINPEVE